MSEISLHESNDLDLLQVQTAILRDLAAGFSADFLAVRVCHLAEQCVPGRIASIMAMREDGRLGVFAAPSAPSAMIAALDGLTPGPASGSCGVAAFSNRPTYVDDAQNDPRWADFAAVARDFDIHACWSHPIWLEDRVIGTFALTGGAAGLPDAGQREWLEHIAAIAGNILQAARQQALQQRQHRRLQRLVQFHAMLAQVNQLAASRPDQATLYAEICRIAVTHGEMSLAWIGVPDETSRFQILAASGAIRYLDNIFISSDPDRPEGQGPAGVAWRGGMPVVVQSFASDARYRPWLPLARAFKLGAATALPLKVKGQTRALLSIYAREDEALDDEFASLLAELAFDIGLALEAIEQQRRLERLHGLYNALLAATDSLLLQRDEQAVLKRTCEHLARSGLFDAVWIAGADGDGLIRMRVGHGHGVQVLDGMATRIDAESAPLTVRALRSGRLHHCNNYFADPSFTPWYGFLEQRNWVSGAATPIFRGGAIHVALVFASRLANCFDREILDLIAKVAQLIGHGLDEIDLKARLEHERHQQFHLARHDSLTGLPNRLQFEEHLQRAISRTRRQRGFLAIGLLDLDDFKPINDVWGHSSGDALLRQLATRLRALLRESDLLARFGGDEFVLAIEGLSEVNTLPVLLNRLQSAVEKPFDLGDGLSVSTAFSLGIALFPEDGDTPDLLLRRADAALYVAKANKGQRTQWWQRWNAETLAAKEFPLTLPDPYGADAARILSSFPQIKALLSEDFVADFYRHLVTYPMGRTILEHVTAAELAHLRQRQLQSLDGLFDPQASREAFFERAQHLGQVYALTDIESALIAQGVGVFQNLLAQKLMAQPFRAEDRQTLLQIVGARLQDLMAAQIAAHERTVATYHTFLLRSPDRDGEGDSRLWVDIAQAHVEALASLPGIVGAELLRPDSNGVFEIEVSGGAAKHGIQPIWREDGQSPHLDGDQPRGRGLLATAWRSQEIQICPNYATDPRVLPWREAMAAVGIRSAAVLPVADMHGRPVFVLALLGAYPRQFSSVWMRQFCTGIMQRLSLLWQHSETASREVIPETIAERWRARLFSGGLQMHYQPLVDFASGKPYQVEALARLVLEDGQVLLPGQFLPALGESDLDLLFRLGLLQSLRQLRDWDAAGLSLGVAVNLPPVTLLRRECALWVRDALAETGIAAHRLSLEILESGRLDRDEALREATLQRIAELGVRVAMDDLGAGFSSLQRLRMLPFHAVKIDQSLVRDARRDPIRVLGFIGALVQLGRDLELDVVLEGLESVELIEAAAILRAKAGQGFALARPMPAAALREWVGRFTFVIDRYAPRTALGALAAQWRFAHSSGRTVMHADRCAIGRFIAANNLLGCEIDALHREVHEIAHQEGRHSARYLALTARLQAALLALMTASDAAG
jgi:diguanylate cyclase (GGDEF)-like protein